jgi:hypothetical protein
MRSKERLKTACKADHKEITKSEYKTVPLLWYLFEPLSAPFVFFESQNCFPNNMAWAFKSRNPFMLSHFKEQ